MFVADVTYAEFTSSWRYMQAMRDGCAALDRINGVYSRTRSEISAAAIEIGIEAHRLEMAAMERETTRWNWGLMIGLTALVVWTALMALGLTP